MDWPALGNSKLKLKGGATTSFRTYTSYLESGKPYTFSVSDKDSILLELYRFRYDASGRLNKIITNVPYVEGGQSTTNDTLIYDVAGNLIRIDRRSSDPSKAGAFIPGSGSVLSFRLHFQGILYEWGCPPSPGCGPLGPDYISKETSNTILNFGVVNLVKIPTQFLTIYDINTCANCEKKVDTFYFHPLMILKDHLSENYDREENGFGDTMLFLYMVDWWRPRSNQETTKDETVTFTLNMAFKSYLIVAWFLLLGSKTTHAQFQLPIFDMELKVHQTLFPIAGERTGETELIETTNMYGGAHVQINQYVAVGGFYSRSFRGMATIRRLESEEALFAQKGLDVRLSTGRAKKWRPYLVVSYSHIEIVQVSESYRLAYQSNAIGATLGIMRRLGNNLYFNVIEFRGQYLHDDIWFAGEDKMNFFLDAKMGLTYIIGKRK
jgi:hypothetical protein